LGEDANKRMVSPFYIDSRCECLLGLHEDFTTYKSY